jgi:hypothetical protein
VNVVSGFSVFLCREGKIQGRAAPTARGDYLTEADHVHPARNRDNAAACAAARAVWRGWEGVPEAAVMGKHLTSTQGYR